MTVFKMTIAALVLSALPALAQDAPADEPLPPPGTAPVDAEAPVSDVAPDDGTPDAAAIHMNCHFKTECRDATCAETGYKGRLIIISDGVGMSEVEWDDAKGSVSLSGALQDNDLFAQDIPEDAPLQRMFSLLGNGEARYTIHEGKPLKAVTYIGSCEVAK